MSQVLGFFCFLKIFVKLKFICILFSLSAYYPVYIRGKAFFIYIKCSHTKVN